MESIRKILVTDDEQKLRTLVCDFLKKQGYETLEAADGTEAVAAVERNPDIALVIMDVMMPELDGWAACKQIRSFSRVPVIMLTARSQEFDELCGFENGADDYVTKPFSLTILLKRIEAILSRVDEKKPALSKGLTIDREAYSAFLDGEPLDLTLKEFEILQKLYENKGRVYTRDQLLDAIWGFDYQGDARTVDSHVARLRTKLGNWGGVHIKTVYGLGYKIES